MYLKARTIQALWPSILRHVLKEGRVLTDERGTKTKELLNVTWTVTDPEASENPEGNPFDGQKLEDYKDEMLNPINDKGFTYTYGERLRATEPDSIFRTVDQIDEAIKHLQKCSKTRRATATTWIKDVDPIQDEVPCLIMVDFKIRNKKLFTTAVWRSQDCYGAIPANFFALRELSRYVAKETKVEVGPITVQSVSCHIYEREWSQAERVVKS